MHCRVASIRLRQDGAGADGIPMGRWVAEGGSGGVTMGHYDRSAIPVQWRLAEEFVLLDHYFQSIDGGSFANHFALISASVALDPDAPDEHRARVAPDGRVLKDGEVTPDGRVVLREPSRALATGLRVHLDPYRCGCVALEVAQQGVHVGRRVPEIEELGLDEALVDAALDLSPERIEVPVEVQDDDGLDMVAELLQRQRLEHLLERPEAAGQARRRRRRARP